MAAASKQLTINKPAPAVYAYLADGLNNANWRSGVQDISLRNGQAGTVGAEYAQKLSGPGGRTIDGDYRLTEASPDRRLAFVVIAGPARPSGFYELEAVPEGTKVTFALELQPHGLMRLMNGMIQKTMDAEVASLDSLKSVLEAK